MIDTVDERATAARREIERRCRPLARGYFWRSALSAQAIILASPPARRD